MNPKIFVGIACAALVVVLGGILLVGPTMIVASQNNNSQPSNVLQVKPLEVELGEITVESISERTATIKVAFKIINPNPRAVIVQTMDYQLYESTYSDYEQIAGGEIGSRPEGMVEFGSNYYTLLGENSIVLKKKITLANTATSGELWDALESEYDNGESGSASWWVTGTVYFNLSSMTSGQENTVPFEFFR